MELPQTLKKNLLNGLRSQSALWVVAVARNLIFWQWLKTGLTKTLNNQKRQPTKTLATKTGFTE